MLDAVLETVDSELPASIGRLFELLRIESISTDPAYAPQVRAAASWLADELTGLGFDAAVRPTDGHPMVVAHDRRGERDPHVLFYAHYDVQPVDPLAEWSSPPFEPRLVEVDGRQRIVARGASDDKGQLMTFVEACRAWIKVAGSLPVKVSMILEGEEESGSANLSPFLAANRDELRADVALVCDTAMWSRSRPAVTIMLRGLVGEEFIVSAADRDLHSGLFGGVARNPNHVVASILAGLHDHDGKVTLPGFYDGVGETPEGVRAIWESLGFDPAAFLGSVGLGVPAGEAGRSVLEQIWSCPTAEVNGMIGGYTGEGFKTVIPARASAKVSFRLVGDQDPGLIRDAFRAYVRSRVPADCRVEFVPHGGSPALRLPYDGAYLERARAALRDEWGIEPGLVGSGGSIPVVGMLKQALGMDSLMIGFALDDDRIHSPNEKYDLASFRGGIRSWVRVLAALAA
jgi:acetylornithine deacetylase/succinyl-diaminopimelate desuccinylase-like protein